MGSNGSSTFAFQTYLLSIPNPPSLASRPICPGPVGQPPKFAQSDRLDSPCRSIAHLRRRVERPTTSGRRRNYRLRRSVRFLPWGSTLGPYPMKSRRPWNPKPKGRLPNQHWSAAGTRPQTALAVVLSLSRVQQRKRLPRTSPAQSRPLIHQPVALGRLKSWFLHRLACNLGVAVRALTIGGQN